MNILMAAFDPKQPFLYSFNGDCCSYNLCRLISNSFSFSTWMYHAGKSLFMSDNKKDVGKRDDIRVDLNDPSEVEYVHKKFPNKSHEEIREARSMAPCGRILKST